MSDEEWVEAAKRGDDDAFYRLMEMHRERLYRMAYVYLREEQEALDAVQETAYRAYKRLGGLKESRYFGTWLIRILLNYCHDQAKRGRRFVSIERVRPATAHVNPYDEDKIDIAAAVGLLKPKHKQIILLKYFEDLTITETAKVMGRSEGTVKTWLHQALVELRRLLGKERERDV